MFCSKCGAQLPEQSIFCSRCGVQIGVVAVSPSMPPFLSRKQFYTSSPQIQEIYEKQRRWTLFATVLIAGGIVTLTIFPPISAFFYIFSSVLWFKAIGPSKELTKMYKEYVMQYQQQQALVNPEIMK